MKFVALFDLSILVVLTQISKAQDHQWTPCSRTCGQGTKHRTCTPTDDSKCQTRYEDCKLQDCPDAACTSPNIHRYSSASECCKKVDQNSCGVVQIKVTSRRVVGGQISKKGQWPWMVALWRKKPKLFFCGGALINEKWVVTAAHCFEDTGYTPEEVVVMLGINEQVGSNPHVQTSDIEEYIKYPAYSGWNDDLALLKLKKTMQYSTHIHPICMPGSEEPDQDIICYAAGWGYACRDDALHGRTSNDLLHAGLRVVPLGACKETYRNQDSFVGVTNRTLCVGIFGGGKDTCGGDSGSPLVCQRKDSCQWYIAGIVAFGAEYCGAKYSPAVYTKVKVYESWILDKITPNPCESDPCLNGGKCIKSGNSYVCECNSLFTGTNCETNKTSDTLKCYGLYNVIDMNTGAVLGDTKQASPCPAGSQCFLTTSTASVNGNPAFASGVKIIYGACTSSIHCGTSSLCGYGPALTQGLNLTMLSCASSCCGDNLCNDHITQQTTTPTRTTPGTSPTTLPDPCSPSPCRNRGKCLATSQGTYKCHCRAPYRGEHCRIHPCWPLPCKNGGKCTVTPQGTHTCNCPPGISGKNCEKDPCWPIPCKHGGKCTVTAQGSYTCACAPGYSGNRCEINPCWPIPCRHGGKCTVTPQGSYTCDCQPGYSGKRCEINPCWPIPCKHGGKCRVTPQGFYTCACAPGYSGKRCEINPCWPNPCKNRGKCAVTPQGSYTCDCQPGLSGSRCERNPCSPNPCKNGGKCTVTPQGSYTCKCKPGLSGFRCEINPCLPNPCRNGGRCAVSPQGSYTCKCRPGFSGNRCQINPCSPNPCRNRGRCRVTAQGTYTCDCRVGYSGIRCERSQPSSTTTTTSIG